jgi:hypothetical protein
LFQSSHHLVQDQEYSRDFLFLFGGSSSIRLVVDGTEDGVTLGFRVISLGAWPHVRVEGWRAEPGVRLFRSLLYSVACQLHARF